MTAGTVGVMTFLPGWTLGPCVLRMERIAWTRLRVDLDAGLLSSPPVWGERWADVDASVQTPRMTNTPARTRATLSGISSRTWEHPADRGALVALRKLKGFDQLLKTM